jgi:hypothetical protein
MGGTVFLDTATSINLNHASTRRDNVFGKYLTS